jgi:hypothetical protein
MHPLWTPQVNALLGSVVVAVGAWLAWDQLSLAGAGVIFAAMAWFLIWRGTTIGLVWAWSTLFLSVESFLWPILTMAQIRSVTAQPSDEQMGIILSAVLMGIFSAVFWAAFSYGLFKRAASAGAISSDARTTGSTVAHPLTSKKR